MDEMNKRAARLLFEVYQNVLSRLHPDFPVTFEVWKHLSERQRFPDAVQRGFQLEEFTDRDYQGR